MSSTPASQCCFKGCFHSPSLQVELTDKEAPLVFFSSALREDPLIVRDPLSYFLLVLTGHNLGGAGGGCSLLWVVKKPCPTGGEQACRSGEQGSKCVEILPLLFRSR